MNSQRGQDLTLLGSSRNKLEFGLNEGTKVDRKTALLYVGKKNASGTKRE